MPRLAKRHKIKNIRDIRPFALFAIKKYRIKVEMITAIWMHNRTRMIAASFLVKDLLIDWRWGERWFMQHLIDGDPAANNGGWQWTAGTDAALYFRVFNPILQGQEFDPAVTMFVAGCRNWLMYPQNIFTGYGRCPLICKKNWSA